MHSDGIRRTGSWPGGNGVDDDEEAGLRILVFPFVCIIGTLIGSAVCGLLFKLSLQESLAIGAGFGLVFAGAGHHHGSRLFNRERDLLFT